MIKVAVLGVGKTGSEVLKLLQNDSRYEPVVFDTKNKISAETWKAVDAGICFLPGGAFLENFNTLISHPKPMIIGSTGYKLSPEQEQSISKLSVPWVMSFNFSIGMSLAKLVLTVMSKWSSGSKLKITEEIIETHHVNKKDAPSGTALLWNQWIQNSRGFGVDDIQSFRIEDQCGNHEYKLILPSEEMSFVHNASSRRVFAEGAVWALSEILATSPNKTDSGKIDFFDLVESRFFNKQTL